MRVICLIKKNAQYYYINCLDISLNQISVLDLIELNKIIKFFKFYGVLLDKSGKKIFIVLSKLYLKIKKLQKKARRRFLEANLSIIWSISIEIVNSFSIDKIARDERRS